MLRSVAAWLVLITFSTQTLALAAPAPASALETRIAELAAFEIHADKAMELAIEADTTGEQGLEALRRHLLGLKDLVLRTRDDRSYRYGAGVALRTARQLGFEEYLEEWSTTFLSRGYSSCSSFRECDSVIGELAQFVDIHPSAALRVIESSLHPLLRGMTARLSKGAFNNSVSQRILIHKLESLAIQARFFQSSGIHLESARGKLPAIRGDREPELLAESLLAAEESLENLHPGARGDFESAQEFTERARAFEHDVALSVFEDIRDFDRLSPAEAEAAREAASEIVQSMNRTRLANQSIALYLERISTPPARTRAWIASLAERVAKGELPSEAVIATAMRFAEFESYLPFRAQWLALTEGLARELVAGENEWKPLIEPMRALFSLRDRSLSHYLNQQGIAIEPSELSGREVALAERFGAFQSFQLQVGKLTRKQNSMAAAAVDFKNAPESRAEERARQRLEVSHDGAMIEWLSLACYLGYARGIPPSRAKAVIPFSDQDGYRLSEACPRDPALGPEQQVIAYVTRKRVKKIWKPVLIELALSVATIPITVASGGLAGLAARPVAAAATRLGTSLATRVAAGRITASVLTKLMPKVVSAVAGAVAFTVVQRASLAAITAGGVPIYDPKKTLLQNYGKDLLFGSTIFFFLPYTAGLSQSLSAKLGSRRLSQLTGMAMQTTHDIAIFTSLPYLEKAILKAAGKSTDPVFNGWGELVKNGAHSAATALAFRIRIAAFH